MSNLQISLLGPWQMRLAGRPVTHFPTAKAQALLVYLAVEAHTPHTRDALIGLFWADYRADSARQNLRKTLYRLRQMFPPDYFLTNNQTVQFDPTSDYSLDATNFARLVAATHQHRHADRRACDACHQQLHQAVDLYHGDFLAHFFVESSPAFEEWVLSKREWLRREVIHALQQLAAAAEAQGGYDRAYRYAWRQVELDPVNEEAHQQIMRALALSGRRSEALRQYETCCRILASELAVEPAQEVMRLVEQIRHGTFPSRPVLSTAVLPRQDQADEQARRKATDSKQESSQKEVQRSNRPVPEIQPSALHPPSPTQRPPPLERAVFVGRETQLAQLEEALAQTLRGHGQLRFITGEAGAGKSALLNEFQYRATAEASNLIALAGVCDAQTGLTNPYLPFREILGRLAADRAARQILLEQGPVLIDTLVPAAALGSHGRGVGPTPRAGPVEQRQIFEQTVKVLQAIADQRPLLLVLEDLHWADDATVGLLFRLGRQLAASRILVLGAYRSEEVSIGRGGEPHPLQKIVDELRRNLGEIHIDLDAARAREGVTLVDALLDTEPNRLDAPFRQALYEHTGGLPLFVVELLRDMQKSGALAQDTDGQWIIGAELNWAELPARVEGMIAVRMARLDAEERHLLTTASVMGEHFIAEAVAQTLKIDGRQVALQLSGSLQKQHRLVQGEGVERMGPQRLTHYRFSHNLMQVYLYEQLDQVERSFLHEDVGYVLEALYGEQVAPIAVQLARHFQAASLAEKAVHYLTLAGEQAVASLAFSEASRHFTLALAQLATLPETTERVQRELALLLSLGAVLGPLKSYTDPEVAHTYSRMHSILPKLGQDPQIFPALITLERFYAVGGEFRLEYEVAVQALHLAQVAQDPKLLVGGYRAMGTASYFSGHYGAARAHLEQSLALYDPQVEYTFNLPDDPGVVAGIFLAWTLWHLGFTDQALLRAEEALRLAQGLTNRQYRETLTLSLLAILHQWRRDALVTQQVAEASLGLATKHGFLFIEALARVIYGWALAAQGETAAGIAQIHRGVAAIRIMKVMLYLPVVLAMQSETYGKTEQVEEGLTLVAEALEMADRSFYWMEANLHLLRGTLQLKQVNGEEAAEASFQRAIALARGQEAKLLELRATVHLARLWRTQGKSQEARQMLAELYGWFSEGFGSVDLREAKALLDQLQMAGT